MNTRILIIEDEQDIAELVALNLGDLPCETRICTDGPAGLEAATRESYDLIILDLCLPGMDGLEICKRLRRDNIVTPVLMLTAKTTELDRILGLELGADDYLTKPFSVLELVARVKAILRRARIAETGSSKPADNIIADGLVVDLNSREVLIEDRRIELTAREFDLLVHFASHPGRVFNRAQLLDQVWGYGHDGYEHTVNSHINRLRNKMEPGGHRLTYIQTVWGVGYRFNPEPVSRKDRA